MESTLIDIYYSCFQDSVAGINKCVHNSKIDGGDGTTKGVRCLETGDILELYWWCTGDVLELYRNLSIMGLLLS